MSLKRNALYLFAKDANINDIALLRLKTPLDFGSMVQPACLPKAYQKSQLYADGVKTILSGWGELDPKGKFLIAWRQ